jgi:uncharacterized protein
MLISFSLQNFYSFADRQTISLVAGAGAKRQGCFSFPTGNSFTPNLLRSACLFGANGAGKSSLVRALDFFKLFVISSAKNMQEGEKIDISSFKLDKTWVNEPTEFELIFISEDVLYQYGFALDTERVWSEWLFCKPNGSNTKMRKLFQREYDSKLNEYIWDINKTYVKGAKEVWKESTRDNALFLSTSIQLKAESFMRPFNWIQKQLKIIESPDRISPSFTARKCEKYGWKDKVLKLVQAVDINIKDVDIKFEELDLEEIAKDILPDNIREKIKSRIIKGYTVDKSYHKGTDENLIPLDFIDESDGSKVAFSLAGPWLDVLENGYTLIIDELHNSLHPHALKFLVNLFHNPQINSNNAQLIFTSHETSVMSKGFMHQDQINLVEKDDNERTKLIPLSDYKVRDISVFQKAYLDGRYGAVPKLKEFING